MVNSSVHTCVFFVFRLNRPYIYSGSQHNCFLLEINTEQKKQPLLSGELEEKLKKLNFKRYQYILIADEMPRERNDELAVIGRLPWAAVFDLDPLSKRNGLLHATLKAAPESIKVSVRGDPQMMTLDEFQDEATSSKFLGSNSRQKGGLVTRWIFCNGHGCEKYSNWVNLYGTMATNAINAAVRSCRKSVVIVFLASGHHTRILSHFITNVHGIQTAAKNFVVVCSDYSLEKELITVTGFSELQKQIIAGMSWTHVSQNIRQLIEGRSASSKFITSSTGTPSEISDDELNTWNEIEVVASNEGKTDELDRSPEEISLDFYKGGQPLWMNFRYDHDIKRDMTRNMLKAIRYFLSNVGKDGSILILLHHYPGTGGTTLCKRLLWEIREDYRCAQILSLSNSNAQEVARQVREFYVFNEADTPSHEPLPVFLLVDSVDDYHIRFLQNALKDLCVKAVILVCKPGLPSSSNVPGESESDLECQRQFRLSSELTDDEIRQVEKIVATCVEDPKQQKNIMQDVKINKKLLYLGLLLFGRQEYWRSLVIEYVKYRLDIVPQADVCCLKFCSLTYTYTYGHKSLPKLCFKELVASLSPGFYHEGTEMDNLTNELLVECCDHLGHGNYTYHYLGFRPAHHFVGEIILKEFMLVDIVKEMFELLDRTLFDETFRHLMVNLFTQRRLNYDDDEDTYGVDADRKSDDYLRYSPLVTALLSEGGDETVETVICFFLTLAQKSRGTFSEGYVWQHLCRLFTHEIEWREVDKSVVEGLLAQCAELSTLDFHQKTLNLTGYDAAHRAIDNAIQVGKNEKQLSNFHHTKGIAYKRQIALYKSERTGKSIEELRIIVDLTQKACEAYRFSKECANCFTNWHPFIDDIAVKYDLLQSAKESTFLKHVVKTGEFRNFLEGRQRVEELEFLGESRLQFVSNLRKEIRLLFRTLKEKLSEDLSQDRGWHLAKKMCSELHRRFNELEREVNCNIDGEDSVAVASCEATESIWKREKRFSNSSNDSEHISDSQTVTEVDTFSHLPRKKMIPIPQWSSPLQRRGADFSRRGHHYRRSGNRGRTAGKRGDYAERSTHQLPQDEWPALT